MSFSPAEYVIFKFGGIRATARALDYAPSAIRKWRQRGYVPSQIQRKVCEKAQASGLNILPIHLVFGSEDDD